MGPAGTRGSGGRPQGVRFGLLRAIRRILQRTGLNDRRSKSPGPYFDHDALVPLIIRSRERVRTNGILSNKKPQQGPASWTPFWILLKWRSGGVVYKWVPACRQSGSDHGFVSEPEAWVSCDDCSIQK